MSDYTTSEDVDALRATIALLIEERDQARRDADGWRERTQAAEQRERVLQAQLQAMREAGWEQAKVWTELGQGLLDAARGWRETGDALPLWEALDAIGAVSPPPVHAPGRGFLARRR